MGAIQSHLCPGRDNPVVPRPRSSGSVAAKNARVQMSMAEGERSDDAENRLVGARARAEDEKTMFCSVAPNDDEVWLQEGRDLLHLWQWHERQGHGHATGHRSRRENWRAPALLLAASGPHLSDLFNIPIVALNETSRHEASVPLQGLQFSGVQEESSPGGSVIEVLSYLRNVTANMDPGFMTPTDEAAFESDTVEMMTVPDLWPANATQSSVSPVEQEDVSTSSFANEEASTPSVIDFLDDSNVTVSPAHFPDMVNGSAWGPLTALASFWDEADDAEEPGMDDDLYPEIFTEKQQNVHPVPSNGSIFRENDDHLSGNVTAAETLLDDAPYILSLVSNSGSAVEFDAAIQSVPALRCDLRSRYRRVIGLVDQLATYVAAQDQASEDRIKSIGLAELMRAVDVASNTTSSPMRENAMVEGGRSGATEPITLASAPDFASNLTQAIPDRSMCDQVAFALTNDVRFTRNLLEAIRDEIHRGVSLISDAVLDLRLAGWRPHRGEEGARSLSLAHFTEAALAAFRQTGLAKTADLVDATEQALAERALDLLSDGAGERFDTASGNDERNATQHLELRQRYAANLLVMRFDMVHWLGVDDDHFLGQLLRYIVKLKPEPVWEASDRLPTTGALLRYVAALSDAYEEKQRAMQAISFLPMKYYRARCFEEGTKHLRVKRLWNPIPLRDRIRSAVYRRCFFSTDPHYRVQYHRQFTLYRERDAERHALYLAETLLQRGGIHPLLWRSQGHVYDLSYDRRERKEKLNALPYHVLTHQWRATVVRFDGTALIVCKSKEDPNSLAVSLLTEDGECQQQLNALSKPRRFPLRNQLAMVAHTGKLALGWLPERDGRRRLAYEWHLVIASRSSEESSGMPERVNATASGTPSRPTSTTSILTELQTAATGVLREYVDSFERDQYTPGSAEWLENWLPFYNAIEMERGTDTYRVRWRRVALDTLEVVAVLAMFGLPVKAIGNAALKAGRAAIQSARRARLLPLARAYQVMRSALPHLRRLSRPARHWANRLRLGVRRGSNDAWRSMRRLYWDRAAAWSLAGRARAPALTPTPLRRIDQIYLSYIQRVFDSHVGMRAMIRQPAGMCHDAALLGRELIRRDSLRVSYRGVLIWREGIAQPANHVVMVIKRGGQTYVLDPTAAQFRRFSASFENALYATDTQWQAMYRHGFYNEVVKFSDFKALAQTERLFGTVPRAVGESLPSSTTLVAPTWYRARV